MIGRPTTKKMSVRYDEARQAWRVDVPPALGNGKRIRRFFPDETAAEVWVAQRTIERATGEPAKVAENPTGQESTVRAIVALYLAAKKSAVGPGQHKLARIHLGKLVARFGSYPVNGVRALDCRDWLDAMDCAQRTRHGVFALCRSFWRWAVRYDYADRSPFDKMEFVAKGEAPKAILAPGQMRSLLKTNEPHYMRAWIVLGGFCGLRTEEMFRMDWGAVNVRTKEIHVAPGVIKRTRGVRERYVAIPANALRMLKKLPREGRVIPVSKTTFLVHAARLAGILGEKHWPRNCLRHSAASYHLAAGEDAGKTAHFLGHTSSQTVFSNYARAVTKQAAREWWGI